MTLRPWKCIDRKPSSGAFRPPGPCLCRSASCSCRVVPWWWYHGGSVAMGWRDECHQWLPLIQSSCLSKDASHAGWTWVQIAALGLHDRRINHGMIVMALLKLTVHCQMCINNCTGHLISGVKMAGTRCVFCNAQSFFSTVWMKKPVTTAVRGTFLSGAWHGA